MIRFGAPMVAAILLKHAKSVKHLFGRVRHARFQTWMLPIGGTQFNERPVGVASLADHHDLQSALQRAPHHGAHRRAMVEFEATPWPRTWPGTIRLQALAMRTSTGRHLASEVFPEHTRAEVATALVHVPDDAVIPHDRDLRHHLPLRALRLVRRQALETRGIAQGTTIAVSLGQKPTMDFATTQRQRENAGWAVGSDSRLWLDRHCYGHGAQHTSDQIGADLC